VTAAVVVLVLICGVRTEEAARLCWDNIELDDDPEVYISPRNAKKFKPTKSGKVPSATRHIKLTPHQVEWLRSAKEAGGLLPVDLGMYNKKLSGRTDARKQARINKIEEELENPIEGRRVGHKKLNAKEEKERLMARLMALIDYMAGVSPWLKGRQNVLRHTYCSMHVARYKNIGLTAHYAGNSERTIRLNYLDVLKPTDAVAFWELIP
jgi:integrase